MSATALSLVIADDLTMQQIKEVMTNHMNILISVKEVSDEDDAPIRMHLHVLAEVEDPTMLTHLLATALDALSQGEPVVDGKVLKGDANTVIAEHLKTYAETGSMTKEES